MFPQSSPQETTITGFCLFVCFKKLFLALLGGRVGGHGVHVPP